MTGPEPMSRYRVVPATHSGQPTYDVIDTEQPRSSNQYVVDVYYEFSEDDVPARVMAENTAFEYNAHGGPFEQEDE